MESSDTQDFGVVRRQAQPPEQRLQRFLQWMQVNGVHLQGAKIKYCMENMSKGFGVYAAHDNIQGVLMTTSLNLAITPMRVLQDSSLAVEYGKLFEEGEVDDRLLMILFLLVERARGDSSFWAPYLDMLPTEFGTPLWFTEQELQDLKGTTLYNATQIQLKNLKALFEDKVKPLVEHFLSLLGALGGEVNFKDFLWANCVFWTRALNVPCPRQFVFPKQLPTYAEMDALSQRNDGIFVNTEHINTKCAMENVPWLAQHEETDMLVPPKDNCSVSVLDSELAITNSSGINVTEVAGDPKHSITTDAATKEQEDTVWVEGLVPGIDFCNHDPRGAVLWEVDGVDGSITGVPYSMYLITGHGIYLHSDEEVLISYGNKGNEELLFLYGFVVENNPDDYIMVHFPKDALDTDNCAEAKIQLLQAQELPMRWLLSTKLLQKGFFERKDNSCQVVASAQGDGSAGYSWSGLRKVPSYLNHSVFPEDTVAALRVIAMKEDEIQGVLSLLHELTESGLQRPPSNEDVRAAVWEVCGNTGALQLLTDLLVSRLMELEEETGSEDADTELLNRYMQAQLSLHMNETGGCKEMSSFPETSVTVNKQACIIYRRGQKQLTQLFLREAEHLLDLCFAEESNSNFNP